MIRLLVLGVALVAGLAWWGLTRRHVPSEPAPFQGYVEGETLLIGPAEAERIERLLVAPGVEARKGEPLFLMQASLIEAQRAEAQARLAQARAQRDNLRSALNRPEQIAVLEAGVARAQAALALSQAEYDRQKTLYDRRISSHAQFDQAEAARNRDAAALDEARRQIVAARLTARGGEIAAAEAAVDAAEAGERQVATRLARLTVVAPQTGVVQDVFFRAGEMVAAGQPVVALLPAENRKIRFYVPEPRLAGLTLGAPVAVACDGCPPGLVAKVSFLAKEVEFTPPVIFSDAERARLVFKAEARFDGAGAPLPLGLPVSVRPAP
jgi:HlyD family secretion protein